TAPRRPAGPGGCSGASSPASCSRTSRRIRPYSSSTPSMPNPDVDFLKPRSTNGQNVILEASTMKKITVKTGAFWVTTVLGPTSFVIGGVLGIRQSPDVVAGVQHLGYPLYFATLLSVWKLLGAIVIT